MNFDLSKLEAQHAKDFAALAMKGLELIAGYTSSATPAHATDIVMVIRITIIDQLAEVYHGRVSPERVMDEWNKLQRGLDDHFAAAKQALEKKFHHDPSHKE